MPLFLHQTSRPPQGMVPALTGPIQYRSPFFRTPFRSMDQVLLTEGMDLNYLAFEVRAAIQYTGNWLRVFVGVVPPTACRIRSRSLF